MTTYLEYLAWCRDESTTPVSRSEFTKIQGDLIAKKRLSKQMVKESYHQNNSECDLLSWYLIFSFLTSTEEVMDISTTLTDSESYSGGDVSSDSGSYSSDSSSGGE